MYVISYPVNNLLMGFGSQIVVPALKQCADKGKPLAYKPHGQKGFDEKETRSELVYKCPEVDDTRVVWSHLS